MAMDGGGDTLLLLLDGEAERRERRERMSSVAEGVEEVVCAHEM